MDRGVRSCYQGAAVAATAYPYKLSLFEKLVKPPFGEIALCLAIMGRPLLWRSQGRLLL